jgi:hypothetical protein
MRSKAVLAEFCDFPNPRSILVHGKLSNWGMARTMPPPGQRLGNLHLLVNRMGADRVHPHAQQANRKVLLRLRNF